MAEHTPGDVSEAVPFTGPIYASVEELAAAVAVDNARHARRTRILVALGFVAFLGGAAVQIARVNTEEPYQPPVPPPPSRGINSLIPGGGSPPPRGRYSSAWFQEPESNRPIRVITGETAASNIISVGGPRRFDPPPPPPPRRVKVKVKGKGRRRVPQEREPEPAPLDPEIRALRDHLRRTLSGSGSGLGSGSGSGSGTGPGRLGPPPPRPPKPMAPWRGNSMTQEGSGRP